MKYAATRLINGVEVVTVTLPLTAVPGWDPENPKPSTVLVSDEVQPGWGRNPDGSFSPRPDLTVRAQRDRLLASTDVVALADRWAAMSDATRTAWAVYRQALRDIPEQTGFPNDVIWPIEPVETN